MKEDVIKQSETPLVTIGVLSYNNARFIIETLDSIKAQTYNNIELIIIDDCSQDNSVELISNWLRENKYPAEFIVNEKNLGIPKNCNKILYRAKGKYLCLFGSDDVMFPERIEKQVSQFEKLDCEYGLIFSDGHVIDEKNDLLFSSFWELLRSKSPKTQLIVSFEHVVETNIVFSPAAMYNRDKLLAIGGYDERLSFEDLDLNLRLLRQFRARYYPDILVKYRKTPKGFSNHVGFNNKDFFLIYKKHLDLKHEVILKKYLEITKSLLRVDDDFLRNHFTFVNFYTFWLKIFLFMGLPKWIINKTIR